MITINEKEQSILFQNDFNEEIVPLRIYKQRLISAYVCPQCKEILQAYFLADEYIPVWKYDGTHGENITDAQDLRYYRYRVFRAQGSMGMELVDHDTHCSQAYSKHFSLLQAVNDCVDAINEEIDFRTQTFPLFESITDRERLLGLLAGHPAFTVLADICKRQDPLLCFDSNAISYEKENTFQYDSDSKEYQNAKKRNEKRKREAFQQVYDLFASCCQ